MKKKYLMVMVFVAMVLAVAPIHAVVMIDLHEGSVNHLDGSVFRTGNQATAQYNATLFNNLGQNANVGPWSASNGMSTIVNGNAITTGSGGLSGGSFDWMDTGYQSTFVGNNVASENSDMSFGASTEAFKSEGSSTTSAVVSGAKNWNSTATTPTAIVLSGGASFVYSGSFVTGIPSSTLVQAGGDALSSSYQNGTVVGCPVNPCPVPDPCPVPNPCPVPSPCQ